MWTPLVLNETNYLLKCLKEATINFYITDFKEMWHEELSPAELRNRFQELNPLFDTTLLTEDDLVERILSLISEPDPTILYTLTKQLDHVTLDIKSMREFSIKYRFYLKLANYATFFAQFTLPLMQTVQYLEMRQKKLVDLLERKDKEIQEHVLENGELTRKAIVTKKFDRKTVADTSREELFVNVFGKSKIFYDTFSEKFGVRKCTEL